MKFKAREKRNLLVSVLPLCAMVASTRSLLPAQRPDSVRGPEIHVYSTAHAAPLKAHVFEPVPDAGGGSRPAIVLFHGGGWHQGQPEWTYPTARSFARLGLVAVAAEYRLSGRAGITPLEAVADARAVLRWLRRNATRLRVDPTRIAAYGVSAGGHLATSTAIFRDDAGPVAGNPAPNALILVSPAVSLGSDRWAQRLLDGRARAIDVSPDEHVRGGLPPTIIFQGGADSVTPAAGARRFCDRMRRHGNRCELVIYPDLGHLLTPADDDPRDGPDPDPKARADAAARMETFLVELGFIEPAEPESRRDLR